LLTSTKFVGSVVIPNRGFFIFGGDDSNLTYSQNLKSVNGVWEAGPPLFENKPVAHHCAVQVKKCLTWVKGNLQAA
jgi:hypothetical protein